MTLSERTTFHYWSDTTSTDPYLGHWKQATAEDRLLGSEDLLYLANSTLDAAGICFADLDLEPEPCSYGTTSLVHKIRLFTPEGVKDHVLRIQPLTPIVKKRYGYSAVERLVQQKCTQAGIYTPRILATDQHLPPDDRPLFTFSIEEFIPGVNGSEFATTQPDRAPLLLQQMGVILAHIHQQRPDNYIGPFRTEEAIAHQKLIGTFGTYRERIMAGLSCSLRRLRLYEYLEPDQANALFTYYSEDPLIDTIGKEAMVLLHGDYGPHNVRVHDEHESMRVAVIDFGDAQTGPVVQELAVTNVFMRRAGLIAMWPALLEGYLCGGGQLPKHFDTSLLALRLRMSISLLPALGRFERVFPGIISERWLDELHDLLFNDAAALNIDV